MAGNNSSGIPSCLVEVLQLLLITRKIAASIPSSGGTFPGNRSGRLQNPPGWLIRLFGDLGKSQKQCPLLQPATVYTSLGAAGFKDLGLLFPKVLLLAGWSLKSCLQLLLL